MTSCLARLDKSVTVVVLVSKEPCSPDDGAPFIGAVIEGLVSEELALACLVETWNADILESWDPVADVENGPSADDVPPTHSLASMRHLYHIHVLPSEVSWIKPARPETAR